jgi:hypothetical protein
MSRRLRLMRMTTEATNPRRNPAGIFTSFS